MDWRPTIKEIALRAGVGSATVDRVLNGRSNVREASRRKVLAALEELRLPAKTPDPGGLRKIAFVCEAGASFMETLEHAVTRAGERYGQLELGLSKTHSSSFEPVRFGQAVERAAQDADAVIVVAREDMTVNRVLRNVVAHKPVLCITTDLPNSHRTAYVGNDHVSAGATAAFLMGRLAPRAEGKILLVVSASYRVQQEREAGFRRVLREEFAYLSIEERVNSRDDPDRSYAHAMSYLRENAPPVGIYNVAGGNSGIGKAIEDSGLAGKVVFIGHELNRNSRILLERGLMDVVIGHDIQSEVEKAIEHAIAAIDGADTAAIQPTPVLVHTKFNAS